jgi:UDP-glucose 4-epimerase
VILKTILGPARVHHHLWHRLPHSDGTCIRDYVHVEDLIDAHVTVMAALKPGDTRTYNLGIGRGTRSARSSTATRRVTGRDFKVVEGPRRAGDPPELYADPGRSSASSPGARTSPTWMRSSPPPGAGFQKHPKGYEP